MSEGSRRSAEGSSAREPLAVRAGHDAIPATVKEEVQRDHGHISVLNSATAAMDACLDVDLAAIGRPVWASHFVTALHDACDHRLVRSPQEYTGDRDAPLW